MNPVPLFAAKAEKLREEKIKTATGTRDKIFFNESTAFLTSLS